MAEEEKLVDQKDLINQCELDSLLLRLATFLT